MQPKVSMVIPCYNKEAYIGNMFDSILAQKWDNIELILVNDGSTDATRRIIAEYEPKFRVRGFEVIIVDQENRGLPGAVYSGLKLITGDYVCQVDADDELDPEYVSAMAGWLAEHQECEWTVCDMLYVFENRTEYQSYYHTEALINDIDALRAEAFLLGKTIDTVHEYMVRSAYLKQSGLLDIYYHEIRRTQEPQFVLPLTAAGGKLKHIQAPLYRYIQNDSMMSIKRTYEDTSRYIKEYFYIVKETINRLPIAREARYRLRTIAQIAYYQRQIYVADVYNALDLVKLKALLMELINLAFSPSPCLTEADFRVPVLLTTAITDRIFGVTPKELVCAGKRIIAWGALGRRGKRVLPVLKGSPLEPTELWDIAGNGSAVKNPDVESLTADDLVLILPALHTAAEIRATLLKGGCSAMLLDDALTYIAALKYPQFYDGSLELIPKGA